MLNSWERIIPSPPECDGGCLRTPLQVPTGQLQGQGKPARYHVGCGTAPRGHKLCLCWTCYFQAFFFSNTISCSSNKHETPASLVVKLAPEATKQTALLHPSVPAPSPRSITRDGLYLSLFTFIVKIQVIWAKSCCVGPLSLEGTVRSENADQGRKRARFPGPLQNRELESHQQQGLPGLSRILAAVSTHCLLGRNLTVRPSRNV